MLAFVDGVHSENRVEIPLQRKKSAIMKSQTCLRPSGGFYKLWDDNSEKLSRCDNSYYNLDVSMIIDFLQIATFTK